VAAAAGIDTDGDGLLDYEEYWGVTDYDYHDYSETYPGLLRTETTYYGGSPASQAVTTYAYDGLGRRNYIQDAAGAYTNLTYNNMNRITQQIITEVNPIDGQDNIVSKTLLVYDNRGRLSARRALPDPDDPNTYLETSFVYDGQGHLLETTNPLSVVTSNTYNIFGERTEVVADDGGIAQTTEYAYDRLGRQTKITASANGTRD